MRYQKIHSQIWNDEKFTKLTPAQQRLFLYILTCPHGNIIGMFVLKQGYIIDDLKYSPKDLKKDLEKLVTEKVIDYDFSTSVVLVKKFLKHNPLTNPNQVKAAKKHVKELPKTKLIQTFIEVLPEVLKEALTKGLPKEDYICISDSVSVSDSVSDKKVVAPIDEKKQFERYVKLTEKEYDNLKQKLGEQGRQDYIERLDRYIGQIGLAKASKKYVSHYDTILNWHNKDVKEGKIQPTTPSTSTELEEYFKKIGKPNV